MVANNEIDIYDISSHKGLKGSLDTRLLTEDGRKDIKEDVERIKRGGQAIGDVATNDAFQLQDTFAHIDETQKDLDVQKAFALANDGKNVKALQGDGVSMKEKQAAIKLYAQIYAETYKIDLESANIIATNKIIYGTSYANNGTSIIDINDIAQNKTRDRGTDALNELYADTMGEYSADGLQFSSGTYNNVTLDKNATTNTHTVTATDQTLLANNNANWRANLKAAREGNGEVDYLLPEAVREWRDNLNQAMEKNRQISASLKGDAVGTALSIAAAPADVVVDLANLFITVVDISTDSVGNTGILGNKLQAEAQQNLLDMGVKVNDLIENREAVAASIVESLKAFPGRIAELDPSALRSLTAIVGEVAMPEAALARIKNAENVAKIDGPDLNNVTPEGNYSKVTDPANTFRTPEDGKLRADVDHPKQTGSFVRDPNAPFDLAKFNKAKDDAKAKNWIGDDGRIIYPDNTKGYDAVPGTVKNIKLQPGTTLTRYVPKKGRDGVVKDYDPTTDEGSYISIGDVPFEQRSLPGNESDYTKQTFIVKEPIPGVESKATPWFDKIGGGNQVQVGKGIDKLVGEDKSLEYLRGAK